MIKGVVKIGGALGNNPQPLLKDLAGRFKEGERWILVHGASATMDLLCRSIGIEPRYVTSPSGYRSRFVGDVEMSLFESAALSVTARTCFSLCRLGVPAAACDPVSERIIEAITKKYLREKVQNRVRILRGNRSGTIRNVRTELILDLAERGFLPVIPPLAADLETFEAVNVDGDRAAAFIASAVGAEVLILLSNVPGLMQDPSDPDSVIRQVEGDEFETASEVAQGNMKRKVLACREALDGGVELSIISDSRVDNPLTAALTGGGTRLCKARSTGIAV